MRHNNILGAIGNTPLVKINRLASHLECNLYAKCEFMNPTSSVKDRIGFNMINSAETNNPELMWAVLVNTRSMIDSYVEALEEVTA
mgnify:CR=1 FL=1